MESFFFFVVLRFAFRPFREFHGNVIIIRRIIRERERERERERARERGIEKERERGGGEGKRVSG